MKKHENLAWEMLTEQERNSLVLTLSNGLSSWEAGEILGLSHYKYLELKERSEKFFKMFSDYFELMPSIFAPNSLADHRFIDYIEGCIQKRLPRKEACLYSGDSSMVVSDISRKLIITNMERLLESENEKDLLTHSLIMEFDRWNNWRILPRALQQPSAYKRRNNKRDKVYINYLNRLPEYKIEALLNIYKYNPRKSTKDKYYISLISEELFEDGYKVISIKTDQEVIKKLSKLFIYIFSKKEHADIFGYQVTRYIENNSSKLGQQ